MDLTSSGKAQAVPNRGYLSIQGLRAIAASAVVLFHLYPFEASFLQGPTIAPRVFAMGDIGVDLFFVISGFIIVTSTRGLAGGGDAAVFLWRRLTRIYPIYWVYTAILLVGYFINPGIFSGKRGEPAILASFLLMPGQGAFLLLVAWTLVYELQFYLLFALTLWKLPDHWLPVALAIWTSLIIASNSFLPQFHGVLYIPFDLLNLDFIAGCVVALLAGRVTKTGGLASLVAGLVLLVGGCILFSLPDGTIPRGWASTLTCGGGFALIVTAAIALETVIAPAIPKVAVALGDSSYSLYLSHLLTGALVGRAFRSFYPMHTALGQTALGHAAALAVVFAISLLVGWMSYLFMERPLLALARTILRVARRPRRRQLLPDQDGTVKDSA
jgi:exopolysaccharide production protein ExoZ